MLTLTPSFPFLLRPSARADFERSERVSPAIPAAGRADTRALDRIGIETALRRQVLPLEPAGAVTPVACATIEGFRAAEPDLSARLGPVIWRQKPGPAIESEILRLRARTLANRAETRTPAPESCRNWSGQRTGIIAFLATLVLSAAVWRWPGAALLAVTGWAALTLVSVTALRTLAALVEFRHARRLGRFWHSARATRLPRSQLPSVSILVPLYDETDIAARLVARLGRLDYPRDRLEIALILETGDENTEAALRSADLPDHMRVIRVPAGSLRTKPRAMNFALDFTRGEIVGIYDAEDRPAPDQLLKIAEAFAAAPPDVACLQGVLDFYNAGQTWLTRCFAIDYAAWFRLILPGLVRLRLVIPLGGTTVFFRRPALEALGRWDAHNVTEDADLGLRLARHGFRCAFVPTVTEEEATAAPRAWIRQRSRWIKGYAVTWAVHMRDPLQLLGELGFLRFLGVQLLFLGTLSQFVLAPFLWSFWMMVFGLPHPLAQVAPHGAILALAALFFLSEIATIAVLALAVATPRHGWLIKWVPLMHLYFPLAALASWKGLAELVSRPFYWDKTAHGQAAFTRGWAYRVWRRPRRPA